MAEGSVTSMSRYAALAAAILVAGGAATYCAFHIPPEKLGEELLGAIIEVLIGVFAVSVLLERHRHITEARARKEEVIRSLYDLWRDLDTARILIATHRSVKTWREQFLVVNRLDEPLSDVAHAVRNLGDNHTTKRATEIIRFVDEVRALLRDLRAEYAAGHGAAADKQEQFENEKKRGVVPSLDEHWRNVLTPLPTTGRLLNDASVVDNLKEGAAMLRRELLGLA